MSGKTQQVATQQQAQPPADKKADPRGEALKLLRRGFDESRAEIVKVLPPQIPFERFKRVVDTAVMKNPDLLLCPPRELFMACMQAASDGLLPDGREGALVIYNMKDGKDAGGKDRWRKAVQWMPMIAGILKKIRNSGELSTIVARIVYAGDKFRNWIDNDGEHIEYEAAEGVEQDRDHIRCVFAMAKLKDGAIEVEVLKSQDIEKIRNVSRAKDKGPWVDWWEQMAQKSALRRLAKRLPMSTDLDDLIRHDDALYDLEGARDQRGTPALPTATVHGIGNKLDLIAGAPESKIIDPPHDEDTGEIIDEKQEDQQDDETTSQSQTADTRQGGAWTDVSDKAPEGKQQAADETRKPNMSEQRKSDHQEDAGETDRGTGAQEQSDADAGNEGDQGASDPQDENGSHAAPTAEDRERMELQAELLSIAQTKAQRGARALKLWLGSIDDDQYEFLRKSDKQVAAYLPEGQEIEWPKRR